MPAKFLNATGDTVDRIVSRVTFVAILVSARVPFAVARKVALVVVNSFKGQSRRAFAHVCKKVSEIKPAFAHAERTIGFILGAVFVASSVHGSRPFRVRSGVSKTVHLGISTATRTASFSQQVRTRHFDGSWIPTIAQAQESSLFVSALGNVWQKNLGNFKLSEYISYTNYLRRHSIGHSMFCLAPVFQQQLRIGASILSNPRFFPILFGVGWSSSRPWWFGGEF